MEISDAELLATAKELAVLRLARGRIIEAAGGTHHESPEAAESLQILRGDFDDAIELWEAAASRCRMVLDLMLAIDDQRNGWRMSLYRHAFGRLQERHANLEKHAQEFDSAVKRWKQS